MASKRELKYNAAGYKDPTAYHALLAAEQQSFTPTALVYICSPYRGDTTRNIRIARQFCAVAVERGYAPIAPHLLLTQFMDDEDPAQRAAAFGINQIFLNLCEELWVYAPRISSGMAHEIQIAMTHQIPIRYFNHDFQEARP